jgi:hypothetical protein
MWANALKQTKRPRAQSPSPKYGPIDQSSNTHNIHNAKTSPDAPAAKTETPQQIKAKTAELPNHLAKCNYAGITMAV